MSHDPSLDFVSYLDANSTRFTSAVNLFRGPVRATSTDGSVPIEAAFVMDITGRGPERTFGPGTEIRYPTVQVRVRSASYTQGFNLTRHIYDTMQSASPSTGNTYIDVYSLQSGFGYLEQDKNMHHHWAVSFRLVYNTT